MASPNVFRQVQSDETAGAVTVRVFKVDGEVVGEPSFPMLDSGDSIITPPLGAAMPVPQAINHAIEMQHKLRFAELVVRLDEPGLWNPEWGTLKNE